MSKNSKAAVTVRRIKFESREALLDHLHSQVRRNELNKLNKKKKK